VSSPQDENVCPAVCGELGSRMLFLELFCEILSGDVGQSLANPSTYKKVWSRLEDATSEITFHSPASGLHRLLLERTLGAAFRQIRPTLEDLLGAEHADESLLRLRAAASNLLDSRTSCMGCQHQTDPILAILPPESTAASTCARPLLDSFQRSREWATQLLIEWGLSEFPKHANEFRIEFLKNDTPKSPLLSINVEHAYLTVHTGVNKFQLSNFLQLGFAFFHEWSAHVATRLAGPAAFCDEYCIYWQKEVYLARANPPAYEYREIVRVVEVFEEHTLGFPAHGTDTAVRLKQSVSGYLVNRTEIAKSAVSSVAWEIVGRLSIAAGLLHGSAVVSRFIRPLYVHLSGSEKLTFQNHLWDLFDLKGIGHHDTPFSEYSSLVERLAERMS
jgi:hypothetical protein